MSPASDLTGETIYMFFGSCHPVGIFLAASGVTIQFLLYFVIFMATLKTGSLYTFNYGPSNCMPSDEGKAPVCVKQPGVSRIGFITVYAIILAFVGKDLAGGVRLFLLRKKKYAAVASVQLITGAIGGYLAHRYVWAACDTDVVAVINTTVILFINDLDEGWYKFIFNCAPASVATWKREFDGETEAYDELSYEDTNGNYGAGRETDRHKAGGWHALPNPGNGSYLQCCSVRK